jgi:hypothetical protein
MPSPYDDLPSDRFWRTGVAAQDPKAATGLYRRRFEFRAGERIATAGSCFAQHIARNLKANGYDVVDTEPAPRGMADETAARFGYRLYSARYGNIYDARRLRQLVEEAEGKFKPKDWIWEKDGRFFDALRPGVEPAGLASAAEVEAQRKNHLQRVHKLLREMSLLVFTFGLTEAWVHRRSGTVYATAPGAIAGSFDAKAHAFVNFGFSEILADFEAVRARLLSINPFLRFLVTVSPVPLTATADDRHVLVATTYSKSVLRAVCGELYARHADLDYFPSYEIVATPFSRGAFFEPNLRSVTEEGVATVMRSFFAEHPPRKTAEQAPRPRKVRKPREADLVCEEAVLEAFAR